MPQNLKHLLVTSSTSNRASVHNKSQIKPFLKWPGGKRWIAKALAKYVASSLSRRYYEPFLGSGAVFFALAPESATISDINGDLINVYHQVRDYPDEIIMQLKNLPVTEADYYRIRAWNPESSFDKAVRFLYLNRTAFGGIYRINKNGKFNVPYGGGNRTPASLWQRNLIKHASIALKKTELIVSDFEKMMEKAGPGDAVYCDPTYSVAFDNNSFKRYNERNFSWEDQKRLAFAAKEARERGALILVSNACHQSFKELYHPFQPIQLTRKSLVSRIPEARREIKEYLFVLDPD